MDARATFLESIELASVPRAALRDSPIIDSTSPISSPALSRKPSYESLSTTWTPTLNKLYEADPIEPPREDQNTRLRRLSMSEPTDGTKEQELPPVDRGSGAWGFVVGAFILE